MDKKIIAITGTHGTGKTTLAFKMAAHYKQLGHNVKVIQEVARRCPFPINENMTLETALWIYHEHSKMELEAHKDHDVVICDRTFYDSIVYADHFGLVEWNDEFYYVIRNSISKYHRILFVKPDFPLKNDGIRSVDEKFRIQVDKRFEDYLDGNTIKTIYSSEIFSPEETWKQYCI